MIKTLLVIAYVFYVYMGMKVAFKWHLRQEETTKITVGDTLKLIVFAFSGWPLICLDVDKFFDFVIYRKKGDGK